MPASYLTYFKKKEHKCFKSLHSAFCTQPAFYSLSAVCILHSVCILPLVRSLQSAVCILPPVRSLQSLVFILHLLNETVTHGRGLCNLTSLNSQSVAGESSY